MAVVDDFVGFGGARSVVRIFLFPASTWKIALVFVGWFFFSRSMAEKSVTLVTVTSPPANRKKFQRDDDGRPSGYVDVCDRDLDATLAARDCWDRLFLHYRCCDVAEPESAAAVLYDPWSEELPAPPT